jgi:hypothetical protein
VEDEGQENMLELGTRGVVLEDEESTPELPRLGDDEGGDVVIGIGVVETMVMVVVRPEVIRLVVLVITEGMVEVVASPGLEDGFDNEMVKPSLVEREVIDAKLLESPEGNEGVDATHVALIIVVEVIAIVVVCPSGRVLVIVVNTLEVVGGIGLAGGTEDDGPITVVDVLVSIVVGPPGIVLVIVIKTLDVESEAELGNRTVDEGLMVIAVVLVMVVEPADMLLVKVMRLLNITELGGSVDGD